MQESDSTQPTASQPEEVPTVPDGPAARPLDDLAIVALTLWGECRGEPVEGKIAVACVIRNRVKAGRFGKGYTGVCLKRWQFSCWLPEGGAENYAALQAEQARYQIGDIGPTLRECLWIAEGVIGGACRDTVKGADHYLTTALLKSKPPSWVARMRPVAQVGAHTFLKDLE